MNRPKLADWPMSDLLLHCGEMTAQEKRTVRAVLSYLDTELAARVGAGVRVNATWPTIDSAPRNGEVVLVNDTTPGLTHWAAAKWIECEEWSGWMYDDPALADNNPLGPNPTHWFDLPPLVTP